MKIPFSLRSRLPTFVALIGILGVQQIATAQAKGGDAAIVARVHGQARISPDRTSWQTMKKGTLVNEGALVQTATKGTADIRILPKSSGRGASEEGTLQLLADTVVGIDKLAGLNATPDIELDLRRGGIEGHVGQLPGGSRFEVTFANGIVGTRNGAVFKMLADGTVSVTSGEVVVVTVSADGTPKSQPVTAGQQYNAATGTLTRISKQKSAPEPRSEVETSPAQKTPAANAPLRKF